jgi:hypothetical protein
MKIEFRFNGNPQAILIPETGRDKQLLNLFATGASLIRLVSAPSSMPEALIFEADSKEVGAPDKGEE